MPRNTDTSAATAARTKAKHERWAAEMNAAGWDVRNEEGYRPVGDAPIIPQSYPLSIVVNATVISDGGGGMVDVTCLVIGWNSRTGMPVAVPISQVDGKTIKPYTTPLLREEIEEGYEIVQR